MESSLTRACTIKIQNFEGPFDLLFHLIGENKVNLYDIPINLIADQYIDYLFAMQELDMEVASEFLVMAATLIHIKSRMLLPQKKDLKEDETDPREELVQRLLEYKKFKEVSLQFKDREALWAQVLYKLPEAVSFTRPDEILELQPELLKSFYTELLEKNIKKMNPNTTGMNQIIQHEKVSLRSKIREIARELIERTFFRFSEMFALEKRTPTDVVTGFIAILEMTKQKRVKLVQRRQFSDILVYRRDEIPAEAEAEEEDYGNT